MNNFHGNKRYNKPSSDGREIDFLSLFASVSFHIVQVVVLPVVSLVPTVVCLVTTVVDRLNTLTACSVTIVTINTCHPHTGINGCPDMT